MLTARDYHLAVRRIRHDIEALPASCRKAIYSVALSGSLVRGDFRPGLSDIDVHVVLRGTGGPESSDALGRVREAVGARVAAVEQAEARKSIVDLPCVDVGVLPGIGNGSVDLRIKTLGFYRFDLKAHHEVLWGEDFASRLPSGPAPRTMVADRLADLLHRSRAAMGEPDQRFRIPMAAVEAVKAIQLLFADPPSIHKDDVSRVYRDRVPDFDGRADGWKAWKAYLAGQTLPDDADACNEQLELLAKMHAAAARFAEHGGVAH